MSTDATDQVGKTKEEVNIFCKYYGMDISDIMSEDATPQRGDWEGIKHAQYLKNREVLPHTIEMHWHRWRGVGAIVGGSIALCLSTYLLNQYSVDTSALSTSDADKFGDVCLMLKFASSVGGWTIGGLIGKAFAPALFTRYLRGEYGSR